MWREKNNCFMKEKVFEEGYITLEYITEYAINVSSWEAASAIIKMLNSLSTKETEKEINEAVKMIRMHYGS